MIENHLRHLLVDRNMSLRQLSEQTGITYSMIYNFAHMRHASVSFDLLNAICRVLEVTPGDILVYRPGDEADED